MQKNEIVRLADELERLALEESYGFEGEEGLELNYEGGYESDEFGYDLESEISELDELLEDVDDEFGFFILPKWRQFKNLVRSRRIHPIKARRFIRKIKDSIVKKKLKKDSGANIIFDIEIEDLQALNNAEASQLVYVPLFFSKAYKSNAFSLPTFILPITDYLRKKQGSTSWAVRAVPNTTVLGMYEIDNLIGLSGRQIHYWLKQDSIMSLFDELKDYAIEVNKMRLSYSVSGSYNPANLSSIVRTLSSNSWTVEEIKFTGKRKQNEFTPASFISPDQFQTGIIDCKVNFVVDSDTVLWVPTEHVGTFTGPRTIYLNITFWGRKYRK